MSIPWEERIASLIAAGGLLWCVHIITQNFTAIEKIQLPMNAVYVTGIGVVIWLHAKWRRSVDIARG